MKQEKTKTIAQLADQHFWESYWQNLTLPSVVSEKFSFERCLCRAFRNHVPTGNGQRMLEIGCAPGRWMIFFHKMLGYQVDGLEYLALASQRTRENLKMNSVHGNVWQTDFFNNNIPPESYDAVLSLGFIEHFDPVDDVIERHVRLIKPGGILILGVPNFRGVNFCLQHILNRSWLEKHNHHIAKLSFFKTLPKSFDMNPIWVNHLGGFEPALFTIDPLANCANRNALRLLYRIVHKGIGRLQRFRNSHSWTDRLNHPWLSSYTLGIYRRN